MLQEAKTDIGIGKAKGGATVLPVDYPMAPKVQGSNLPEVCYWIGLEMVVMYFTNHTVIRRKMWFDGCSGTCGVFHSHSHSQTSCIGHLTQQTIVN